jgi:hypothetical protein
MLYTTTFTGKPLWASVRKSPIKIENPPMSRIAMQLHGGNERPIARQLPEEAHWRWIDDRKVAGESTQLCRIWAGDRFDWPRQAR